MLNQILIAGNLQKVTAYTDGSIKTEKAEWKEKQDFLCTTLYNVLTEDKSFIEVRFHKEVFAQFLNMKETVHKVKIIGRLETEISRGTGIVSHYILVQHVSIED